MTRVKTHANKAVNRSCGELTRSTAAADKLTIKKTFFLLPEFCPPELRDQDPPPLAPKWVYKQDTTMHPFWAVRRLPSSKLGMPSSQLVNEGETAKRFNMEYTDLSFYVSVGGTVGNFALLDRSKCTFQGICNSQHIIAGSELVLEGPETTACEQNSGEPAGKKQRTT